MVNKQVSLKLFHFHQVYWPKILRKFYNFLQGNIFSYLLGLPLTLRKRLKKFQLISSLLSFFVRDALQYLLFNFLHLLKEQIGSLFMLNADEFVICKQCFLTRVNIIYKNTDYEKQYNFWSVYYQKFLRVFIFVNRKKWIFRKYLFLGLQGLVNFSGSCFCKYTQLKDVWRVFLQLKRSKRNFH